MIVESMCKLALGDLVGDETAEAVGGLGGLAGGVAWLLHQHFSDHSQRLPRALHRSNQRAWRTLELALAGDGWLTKLKNLLARGEDKAMAAQIRAFLEANCLKELDQHPADVRQLCLEDLQKARAAGQLEGGQFNGAALAEEAKSWEGLRDPQDRLKGDLQAVSRMAAHLRQQGYPHLSWLLDLQVHQSHSLLVVAVRYYFRREVESNRELFQGLVFAQVEQLDQHQAKGFAELNQVLADQWELLNELLKGSVETLEAAIAARAAAQAAQATAKQGAEAAQQAAHAARAGQDAARAGHEAVLDLKEELQRQVAGLGQQHRQQFEQFFQPVMQLLEKLQLQSRPLRATDSMSIRTDHERREAEQIVKRYRALPAEQRRRFPALLNGLGQLEFAVNDFENAQTMFAEVATLTPNLQAQALAHYNAYRAALERLPRRHDDALKELLQAVALDPDSYAPFPVKDYEPLKILGAGGFGVTFLCRNSFTQGQVAIKALTVDGLDREVTTVFSEAQALDELQHPSVIRLRHCGFADTARRRPYLIMDYFAGQTLEEFVEQHGKLKVTDFLGLARLVAEALAAAHHHNILHRDIKPANLLVRREQGKWQVRVIDFGLAMRQSVVTSTSTSKAHQDRTLAGASIAGTIDYAAPEQLGKLPGMAVGPASDVYGFAKTCCFALMRTTEPTLEDWDQLPKPLAQLLSKCMARTPDKRPQNFQEVLKGLDGVTAKPAPRTTPVETIPVVPVQPFPPVQQPPRAVPVLIPAVPPSSSSPPPLPVQAQLIEEVLPARLIGRDPGGAARGTTRRPTRFGVMLVRLFGSGGDPTWLERMGKSPRKFKVYFDGEYIGEGDESKGIDLRVHTKPGKHTIVVKALENVSPTIWSQQLQEMVKTFQVEFTEVAKYSVRFDYLGRGKLDLVTVDIIRARG